MINLNVRKIYQRVNQGEITHALVAYYSIPYERSVKETDEGLTTVTLSYDRWIRIDLWILVIDINWIAKND